MKQLNEFVIEKLQLNPDSKISTNHYKPKKLPSAYNEDDFPIKTRKKNGDKFQWFQWWEYLMYKGPMSKHDLLVEFDLAPTSYSTQFTHLSRSNIIVPQKGKWVAMPPEEWKVK